MSAPKHRYELVSAGAILARYQTLGQALLGAVWRSRSRNRTVYVRTVGAGRPLCQVYGGYPSRFPLK